MATWCRWWFVLLSCSGVVLSVQEWQPLGCYKDSSTRTMPHYFGTVKINWTHPNFYEMFSKCKTKAEGNKYTYFGIQYYKECWGSPNARLTYDDQGCADNCLRGVNGYGTGGKWSHYVYRVKEEWTECIALECVQYKIVLLPRTGPRCNVTADRKVSTTNETRPCPDKNQCAVDGNWTSFSNWSSCNKECGGGKEFKNRTCTNPAPTNGGKQCVGLAVESRPCNEQECPPKQCSVDHLLKFVINLLPPGSVEINNQFIGALRQVVKAIEIAKGMPLNYKPDKTNLIDRIKRAVSRKSHTYARTMLGFLLQKQLHCHLTAVKILREIKDALGEDKFKDFLAVDGDVSLVFTLDTTGSMTQEIPQAKALAKALNGYNKRGKVEYILSIFNDPDCGPVKKFTKTEKTKFDAAIDRLYAFGGGDCQEPAFEGIINAIDHGAPYSSSPMYVFTDSPSKIKGHHTDDAAIGLALDHMMPINFIFSPYGCSNPRKDSNYGHAMEDTGGLDLFFPTPLSFYRVENVVKADLDGTTIIAAGGTMGGSGGMEVMPSRIEFPVDKTIHRLIVSVAATSNDNGVDLVDSNDNVVSNLLSMFQGKLWVVEDPSNGSWALTVQTNVRGLSYMIKASNIINIDFDHVFVRTVQPSGQQVQISNPLKGEKARAKIIIPQISRLNKKSLQLHLLDKNGTVLAPLALSDDEVSFDLPGVNSFRIRLTGNTTDGDFFMRTSPNIRQQAAIMRTQILQDLMNIKRGRISYFRAMIDSASDEPRVFRLVGSSFTRGIQLTLRRTVRVTKSRPGYIPVFVVTRYKVPSGSVAKIQIVAKSSDLSINLIANLMVT